LDQLKIELAQAQQQAKSLAEQLAAAERQAHWRQLAQAKAAKPLPEPPGPVHRAPVTNANHPPPVAGPARPSTTGSGTAMATHKNSLGMELIRVPAGKYERGARDGEAGSDHEKPRHWVQISKGFEVGKHEVTQAVFTKVMGVTPSWFSSTGGGSDKVRGMDTSDLPVEQVSWFDAIEFCNKLSVLEKLPPYYELTNIQRDGQTIANATVRISGGDGYRLLTEAEWEYVARAGTTTIFPWGDSLSSTQANRHSRGCCGQCRRTSQPAAPAAANGISAARARPRRIANGQGSMITLPSEVCREGSVPLLRSAVSVPGDLPGSARRPAATGPPTAPGR
jgi:formylglycine-generating enzyme required for sulfatase activity